MKKKLMAILSLILSIGLAACGAGGDGGNKGKELDLSPSAELSDDLESFQIQVDGVVYTLPSPINQLIENGWEARDDMDFELEPFTYTNFAMIKDDVTKYPALLNNSETETKPASECEIGGFEFVLEDAENGISVVLPGGLSFGATYDEIVAAYGEPDSRFQEREDGTAGNIEYNGQTNNLGESSYWFFFFDEETGGLNEIRVKSWTVQVD